MGNQNQFVQIAPGIRLVGEALVADVRIGSARNGSQRRITKRFTRGTPEFDEFDQVGTVTKLEAWQYQQKHDLILAAPVAPEFGTFEGDVPTWLHSLPAGLYHDESVAIMAHWIGAMIPQEKPRNPIRLGTMSRHALTRLDVVAQLSRWEEAGAAIATCNKRLSRLRKFYQAMNGLTEPNPTDKITFTKEPEPEPRDMPLHIVQLILDSLPDMGRAEKVGDTRPAVSQTKTRLLVMAWTGMAPSTLRRVKARDLDLAHARIYLTPRRKGKGTKGAWVALLPEAVVALKAFVAAGLIGKTWARSSVRKTWHRGIARATKAAELYAERTGDTSWLTDLANLPPNCKPYDLRHSFAAELYRVTGDIRAVGELLQHADLETTKRYTKGAVSERVTAAIATARDTRANMPTIPPVPTTKAAKARAAMRLVRKAATS